MRRIALLVIVALAFVVRAAPGHAHGEAFTLAVESLQNADASFGYGIALGFEDGDPAEGASVRLEAVGPGGRQVEETAVETAPGVYIGTLVYPTNGLWRVTVTFDHDEGGGSATFDEIVPVPAGSGVVTVKVDSEQPEREGATVEGASAIFAPSATDDSEAGPDVGVDVPIRVEALVSDEVRPLEVRYGVAASLARPPTIRAVGERSGLSLGPLPLAPVGDGRFVADVSFPDADVWTVTIQTARGTATFTENLPWPHYSIEAGHPKVKVDSHDPGSVGELLHDVEASPIFGASPDTGSPATGTSDAPAASPPTPPPASLETGAVVIDIDSPAEVLRAQVLWRWAHLTAIAAWVLGVGLLLASGDDRVASWIAAVAVAGTVGTGGALVLYGAPVTYPGILRWNDLAERLYGASYEAAFVLKMVAVALAIAGTVALVARRSRIAAFAALAGIGGAAAAVTAMVQFHLFAHL